MLINFSEYNNNNNVEDSNTMGNTYQLLLRDQFYELVFRFQVLFGIHCHNHVFNCISYITQNVIKAHRYGIIIYNNQPVCIIKIVTFPAVNFY